MKLKQPWIILIAVNIVFGLLFWFLSFTNYSIIGTIPDTLLPVVVGILAIVSLRIVKAGNKRQRFFITLAHLPSLIGSGLSILMAVIMFIPPFTLGALFRASEISHETLIQRAVSPDGMQTAYVYFRGVGAYSGGNGRIFVRVRSAFMPFFEKDVFYLSNSHADEESSDYLEWLDRDTLYIPETEEKVMASRIKLELPEFFIIPVFIVAALSMWVKEAMVETQQTAPVRDIPIFPGDISHDQSQYLKEEKTAFRSLNVVQQDVNTVEQWYEMILAKSPWQLVQINHHTFTESDVTYDRYCIQAVRESRGETQTYFFEFFGSENGPSDEVHINIGSPNPVTDACQK